MSIKKGKNIKEKNENKNKSIKKAEKKKTTYEKMEMWKKIIAIMILIALSAGTILGIVEIVLAILRK